jgi:ribosomal protein S16
MRHYYRYRFNGGPDILKNAPPGTGTINTAGYRIIYVSGRRRREHDVIAEREIIHRPLMPDEVVHHINKNRLDNRIENLAVMTRKAHMAMHRAEQLKAGTS